MCTYPNINEDVQRELTKQDKDKQLEDNCYLLSEPEWTWCLRRMKTVVDKKHPDKTGIFKAENRHFQICYLCLKAANELAPFQSNLI